MGVGTPYRYLLHAGCMGPLVVRKRFGANHCVPLYVAMIGINVNDALLAVLAV